MESAAKRIGNWTPDGKAERAALRRDYLELTPAQRVEQVFELSRFMSQVARRDVVGAVPELDIPGLLRELVQEGVDFLVIGGVAVGFHGYVRATKDVDVVPAPDPENLERLARVLRRLGAEVEGAQGFESEELPDPLDPSALALGGNWVLRTRLGRCDIRPLLSKTRSPA